jgi:hypothetical protein
LEVAALWGECRPVGCEKQAVEYLKSRALDAGNVEELDIARALPRRLSLPDWAGFGPGKAPWNERGYLLVVPMFDMFGALRSLHARKVVQGGRLKSLSPADFGTKGLVMADAHGRNLLVTGKRPSYLSEATPLRIVVSEGEVDFWTWSTRFSDADPSAPAVFGMFSGGWTDGIGSRVPDGSRVIIRTDADEAGDRYAREIRNSLHGRCTILRGGKRETA